MSGPLKFIFVSLGFHTWSHVYKEGVIKTQDSRIIFMFVIKPLCRKIKVHTRIAAHIHSFRLCIARLSGPQGVSTCNCSSRQQTLLLYRVRIVIITLKARIYRTKTFRLSYKCETKLDTLRERQKLRVFQQRVLRRLFGSERE
jgi:hypothetical protein